MSKADWDEVDVPSDPKRMRTFPFRFSKDHSSPAPAPAPAPSVTAAEQPASAAPKVRSLLWSSSERDRASLFRRARVPLRELRRRGAASTMALELQELIEMREEEALARSEMQDAIDEMNMHLAETSADVKQMRFERELTTRTYITTAIFSLFVLVSSTMLRPDLYQLAQSKLEEKGLIHVLVSVPVDMYFIVIVTSYLAALHWNVAWSRACQTWGSTARMLVVVLASAFMAAEAVILHTPNKELDAWVHAHTSVNAHSSTGSFQMVVCSGLPPVALMGAIFYAFTPSCIHFSRNFHSPLTILAMAAGVYFALCNATIERFFSAKSDGDDENVIVLFNIYVLGVVFFLIGYLNVSY